MMSNVWQLYKNLKILGFRQGDGMTPPFFHNSIYEMQDHQRFRPDSPSPRSPRFGSLRRRKRVERMEYFEDTSEGSDGRTSSDEYESSNSSGKKIDDNNNNNGSNTNQKHRKNSHFGFSNVKKKITSTFQRRHSVAMHPPSTTSSTTGSNNKPMPIRRSSAANHSPRLLRQQALDDSHPIMSTKRKTSLRRHVTMAAVRLHEQNQVSSSNPMLDRILQKSQFQLESSSSTPDIQAHSRTPKLKTFKIHILGSKSVGKTGKSVFLFTYNCFYNNEESFAERFFSFFII